MHLEQEYSYDDGESEGDNFPISPKISANNISEVIHYLHAHIWKALKLLVPCFKQIHDRKVLNVQALEIMKLLRNLTSPLVIDEFKDALSLVTRFGITECFIGIVYTSPGLLHVTDIDNRNLFHLAVLSRQDKIYNLIYGLGPPRLSWVTRDKFGNNILHMAAFLSPQSQLERISGAALQMQRELQWFHEVEKLVDPRFKATKNNANKTPRALFTEQHRELVKEGEKWMKETAQACMVVSTLIATVMFAAAFTIPGGNKGDTGTPIFLKTPAFNVFIISDAVSLIFSCTSVLMFLAILTARYAEDDFLRSLPQKLIFGLGSLFISIATMMAAYGATLVIVLSQTLSWAPILVASLAIVPVALFAILQFPLFMDIVLSTYGPGIFHRK